MAFTTVIKQGVSLFGSKPCRAPVGCRVPARVAPVPSPRPHLPLSPHSSVPHWPPLCSSLVAGALLPQGLCTSSPLVLECFFSRSWLKCRFPSPASPAHPSENCSPLSRRPPVPTSSLFHGTVACHLREKDLTHHVDCVPCSLILVIVLQVPEKLGRERMWSGAREREGEPRGSATSSKQI